MAPAIRLILLLAIALWPGPAAAGEVREDQLALSPAIWRAGGVSWSLSPQILEPEGLEQWFPRTTGESFDWQVFRAQSPFALVAGMAAAAKPPRVFLGVGDDDYFALQDGTMEMYLELRAHGLRPELRVLDGGHDWRLWSRLLDDVLRFLEAGWPPP